MLSTRLHILSLLLLVNTFAFAQTIRYVTPVGKNTNPATAVSWATSTTDLQGAINASQAGDQVWVAGGTYKPGGNANVNRSISFSMKNDVAIYGGFTSNETTLSQRPATNPVNGQPSSSTLSGEIGNLSNTSDNSYHVVSNYTGLTRSALLDGFVITGGSTFGSAGGGVFNSGVSPTFRYCLFYRNYSDDTYGGGAMFNSSFSGEVCNPLIVSCVFQSNSTIYGGGGAIYNLAYGGITSPVLNSCLFVDNSSTNNAGGAIYSVAYLNSHCNIQLTDCRFQKNSAYWGGAIYTISSSNQASYDLTLTRCFFVDNMATNSGGAVYGFTSNSSIAVSNCVFHNNKALESGGAIYAFNIKSASIESCYFSHNSADLGGAINCSYIQGDDFLVTNCAFIKNSANFGGAIRYYVDINNSSLQVINCSFLNNSAAGSGAAIHNSGHKSLSAIQLTNCVLFGNGKDMTFTNAYNALITITYSLVESASISGIRGVNVSGPGNLTNIITSPFVTDSTVILANCSPAINSGNPNSMTAASAPYTATALPAIDLEGHPRIIEGRIDMGAIEYQSIQQPIRLYVNANATGNNTGLDWKNAFTDFHIALSYPCSDSLTEIWVASGIYKPGGQTNTNRKLSFAMKNNVAIYGGFTGDETALSQRPIINPIKGYPSSSTLSGELGDPNSKNDNSYHVIHNPGYLTSTAVLDGFVITGGNADGLYPHSSGGGILNVGIYLECSPVFRNCSIEKNSAYYGGGLSNDGGYGISNPTIINCLFNNNLGNYNGGALYNYGDVGNSNPTIINSLFLQNSSGDGGAIYNYGQNGNSSPVLMNCAFIKNRAINRGGAIYNYGYDGISHSSLTNCTFLSNSAAVKGGAIENYGYMGISRATLTNCISFDNGPTAFDNVIGRLTATYSLFEPTSVSGNFNSTNIDISGPGNLTNITVSPFASTTSVVLAPNSPAINAGDPATSSATVGMTDLAGNPRFVGRIDMGAVEFQGILEMYTLKNGNWNDPSVWSLSRVPQPGERVRLRHTVTIPAGFTASGLILSYDPDGRLIHEAGTKLQLGN